MQRAWRITLKVAAWKVLASPEARHLSHPADLSLLGVRGCMPVTSACSQVLHPDTLLAVLFLGCWVGREAVTGMDILRWANDGSLPFLSLGALSKPLLETLDAASLGFPLPLLEPSGIGST